MTTVAITHTLDHTAIMRAMSLREWINLFNREHDAFLGVNLDTVTWDSIYHLITMDYLTGGDWSEYVNDVQITINGSPFIWPDDGPTPGVDVHPELAGAGPTPATPGTRTHGNGVFSISDDDEGPCGCIR